jgi:hypothetical protein
MFPLRRSVLMAIVVASAIPCGAVAQRGTPPKSPAPATQKPASTVPYTTPLTVADMTAKQAVVHTTAGTIVFDLRPDLAPNHVGYFMKLATAHSTGRSSTASFDWPSFRVATRCRKIRRRRSSTEPAGSAC